MFCGHCGAETAGGEAFCRTCGSSLSAAPSPRSDSESATQFPSRPATAIQDAVPTTDGRAPRTATSNAGAADSALSVGQAFGTRYHIIRELGRGGMGVVYQAWDQELGIAVALKTIRPDPDADPEAEREREMRFKRELVLARQVTHKHVVRIHDLGEINGIKYLTMPFIQGESLAARIRRQGKLPLDRALHFAKQVAAGLAAAHEAGVVHRDLKPANIMIDAEEQAVILDFGLARSTSGMTMGTATGAIMGTFQYMAPEQASGARVDERADVYAFGLIFRDMLLGVTQTGETPFAVVMQRMQAPPPSVHAIDAAIPEPVDHIIQNCLQPDPAVRYQSAAELAADLAKLDSSGHPLVHLAPPAPVQARTRWLVPAFATVAVVLLAAIGWLWFRGRPAPAIAAVREPISVLIADFENKTGDEIFEASLEQALAIALEGSPFISVYPQKAARALAAQLSPASGSHVSRDVGQLICRREAVKVLVSGTIEGAGSRYHLVVRATDPSNGRQVAAAERDVSNKAEVLQALASLSQNVRRDLGETTTEMTRVAAAETFTAGSIEAMRAYARGQELLYAGNYQEALKSLQEAVRQDPGLGRAYSAMGAIYVNLKQSDRAEASFQLAMKNLDRMSEREKYRTLATYYLGVAGNYEKAIENYEALIKAFPADNVAYGNLAVAYVRVGNIARAKEVGARGLQIYPRNLMQRTNYAAYCVYAGDFETASREAERVLAENAQYEFAYLPLALSKAGLGDVPAARKAYERLAGMSDTGRSLAALGLADLDVYAGRLDSAADGLRAGIALDEKLGNTGELATKHVVLAEITFAQGARPNAISEARKAVAGSALVNVVVPAGRLLFEAGAEPAARDIVKDLDNRLQNQTSAYSRILQADAAVAGKRYVEAIDLVKDALKRQDTWLAHFVLGRAYFEAGHAQEALDEWEGCYKRRGEVMDLFFADSPTVRYLPPLLYWVGRAREAVGDKPGSATAYRQYVSIREGATADPLLADARRRLGS